MTMTRYDYFCDYQMKRFTMQIVRAFSGFQYMTGRRGTIEPTLKIVPCITAQRNRQVAAIKQNLSENTLNAVPMISVDQTGLTFDMARLQSQSHVGSVQVFERAKDTQGNYTGQMGNATTIERLMPLPFTMEFQVDIWTSNTDQKHQLIEQIVQAIYPTFSIQNSDNPLDWTALTDVHPKDLSFNSITVPIGNDNALDISSITLEVPIWLTPPAKIKRQTVIEQIIVNINHGQEDDEGKLISGERMSQQVVTLGNHHVDVSKGMIKLLGSKGQETDSDGEIFSWSKLLDQYGKPFLPAQTQLRLAYSLEDDAPEIIGRLQEGGAPNLLEWQIDMDTLPANTMSPVDAVIDPTRSIPGDGLPVAAAGQRYLIIEDLPAITQAWGLVGAQAGAILQFTDGAWTVASDGSPNHRVDYILNLKSSSQLRWDGSDWTLAIDGTYAPGFWRII